MKTFVYKAASRDGAISNGKLAAADRSSALDPIETLGLQPLSLTEEAAGKKPKETERGHQQEPIRLKLTEVLEFTEELAELLRGGIHLERSLAIIERRKGKSRLPLIAREIRSRIRDGKTLSDALRSSSPDFGELYCRLVAAGEESGALTGILTRQAEHLKALQALKSGVIFAMIYPAFLCLSAVGVVVMFVTYLIPKLMDLLESTGGSLPGGARFIIGLSESFKSTWGFWLGLIVGLILFCSWFARHRSLEWDKFLMASPLLGKVLHLRQQVLFLETMSSLLENGLPIVNALSLTRNAIPSPMYRKEIDLIRARVQDGEGLSNSLVHSSCFPTILTDLISVGEETGDLSGAMERASVRFEAELKRNVERISAIIQPTVVIVMAVMVGFMAYLMISAIFQTVSGLGA